MKFKIDTVVDIAGGKPALLIPIFKMEGSNLPYAQEMNDAYEIHDMQPYVAADYYPYEVAFGNAHTDIGERGIICFRSFDGNLIFGTIGEIIEYYNNNRKNIESHHLLDMQLARTCGEQFSVLHDKWQTLSTQLFTSAAQRLAWRRGEHTLHQKNRNIWNKINEVSRIEKDDFIESLTQHSFEYLFRWLVINTGNKNWPNVWMRAFRLSPFDERMSIIARDWLIGKLLSNDDFNEIRLVLFVFLETETSENDRDFSEALTDFVVEDTEKYYQFLTPEKLPLLILKNLDTESNPDGCLLFSQYLLNRLEGDPRYGATIKLSFDFTVAVSEYIKNQQSNDEYTKKHSTTILREWRQNHKAALKRIL